MALKRSKQDRQVDFHEAQKEITRSKARFRVVCCGRRFGKTTLAIYEMIGKAYAAPDRKICYIAPTHQQARDIAWSELVKACAPITERINETRLEIIVHSMPVPLIDGSGHIVRDLKDKPIMREGQSTIIFRGWESLETLRGQAFDFIVLDEVASMKNWDSNWNTIIFPTLTDRAGEVLFISTPKGFNDFYKLYNLETTNPDFKSFHFTSYDNPFIPKEEIDKARAQLTEDQFAQEYLADFRKMEGLVYKEFNRAIHVTDKEPESVSEYFAGVDFGFVHPCAVIHIAIDRKDVWWVTDEWVRSGRTEDQVAAYVKSCSFQAVWPDPAMPSAIDTLNRAGVPVREVNKGRDSVKTGIDKVRMLLKQNRLMINKKCVNLIASLERYVYDGATEIPVKENDDEVDALRYAVMSRLVIGGEAQSHYVQPEWEHPMQGEYGPSSSATGKLLGDFEWQTEQTEE